MNKLTKHKTHAINYKLLIYPGSFSFIFHLKLNEK